MALEAVTGDDRLAWKVSAKWATRRLDCTLSGIVHGCYGGCCHSRGGVYWPARAYSPGVGPCFWLGQHGCRMAMAERPITCLMYPLVLNRWNTWVMHFRGRRGCCAPNVDKGPMLIDALAANIEAVFGQELGTRVCDEVRGGRDAKLEVPDAVAREWEYERGLKRINAIPTPRSEWLPPPTRRPGPP